MNIPLIRKLMPKVTLNRYHIAGLITGVLLVAALILPSVAAGVSASLATSASSYVLGSTISMPASVDVGNGEFTKVSSATLTITGPQPVTKSLPTTPTSGQQDLGDGVKVTTTFVNLQSADGTGYGYPSAGSGYVGYASGAKINYAITWQPPVFLNPPPPTPPPSLPGTNQLFTVPSGSGTGFQSPILDLAFSVVSGGSSSVAADQRFWLLGSQNFGSGSSNQRIMILDGTGAQLDVFQTDSSTLDGLTAVGSSLYAYDNDNSHRELVRIDKSSPHSITRFPVNLFSGSWVGALAYDGTNLIAGARDFNNFQKLTTTGGIVGGQFSAPSPGGFGPPPNGADDLDFSTSANTLFIGKFNTVFRWNNPGTGGGGGISSDQVNSPFTSFGGIEAVGSTFYMVSGFSSVYVSTNPGASPPETTTVGSYSAQLSVSTATVGAITSSVANFSLAKASSIGLAITTPTNNQAFSTASISVSGTVTDLSVGNISVGVVLPVSTVFSDGAESGETKWSKSGLWHISDLTSNALKNKFPQNLPAPKTGTKVWWYGQESTADFNTGGANSGDLNIILYGSASTITVTSGTTLSFQTWYDTEPGSFFDKKIVQFVESSGPTEPAAQIVDPGMPLGGSNCGSKCQWVQMVPSAFASFGGFPPPPGFGGGGGAIQATSSGGGWALVSFNLDQFNGKTGKIRFKFDSVDGAVNNGKGWFIDDVSISGQGFSGATVPVNTDGTWSTTFTLAEGSNPVTASATSAYLSGGPASQTVTASLDTTAPIVTLSAVTTPTGTATQTLSGTVVESNFDLLTVTNNGITVATSKTSPTGGAFSQVINLFPGTNSIVASITDKGGLTGSATASIVLDADAPTVTVNATRYPVGNISARTGDQVIFDVTAADALSGMQKVELVPTGSGAAPTFLKSTDVPAAVLNQWGTSGNFLLPMEIPSSAASGTLSFTIKAYDNAGNIKTSTVSASVVASLQAFTINLLPDWNFISLPLTPDSTTYAATQTQTQIQRLTSGLSGLDAIWYYDASVTDPTLRWKVYNASGAPGNLTELGPGRGYWTKMTSSSFTFSDPLAPGLPSTPAPKKFTYTGTLLQAGANATPPVYPVPAGWVAVGFHSERTKTVSQALRSVSVPTQIWGSLLAYDNYILFQRGEPPQIVLGAFKGKDESNTMEPGRGYWIFMQQAGNIVPTN